MSEQEYLRLTDVELKLENSKKELEKRLKSVRAQMEIAKEAIVNEFIEDGVVPFNLVVKRVPPKAIITDEDKIPEKYWRIKKEVNKIDINKAMKDGEFIDGVTMDNGGWTVAIKAQNVKAGKNTEQEAS